MSEIGFTCPVTLTMSVAFVLEQFGSSEQRERFLPRLASMDPTTLQQGGTFLTEIEGGSDVGAITTKATPNGDHYLLTGEKWFTSNADAEIALVLARVGDVPGTVGLGLFIVPRTLPDGSRNRLTIRRLKDKLGTRAVASGEIELHGAVGYPVGDVRRGFRYMAEALNVSRMCTATGSLALSRTGLFGGGGVHEPAHRLRAVPRRLRHGAANAAGHGHGHRGGLGAGRGDDAGLRPTVHVRHAVAPRRCCAAASCWPWRNTASAKTASSTPGKPWSCTAETATWRTTSPPACCGTCRSTRCGRAPPTSWPWKC